MSFDNFFEINPITIKYYDTLLNDSKLQWSIYGRNQERIFKDQSTDYFTKIFLGNNKLRWIFVDYIFNTINYKIQCKINKYLKNKYQTYLFEKEKIYIVFKGGNVMNFYYDALKTQINEYKKNCSLEITKELFIQDINNFLKELDKNFSISDVDFSIYIKCEDYIKFCKISNCCKIILLKSLKKISDDIDIYFQSVVDGDENILTEIKIPITTENNQKYFNDICEYMVICDKIIFEHLLLHNNFVEKIIEKIGNINELVELYMICINKSNEFDLDINDKLKIIKNKIKNILSNKFHNLKANNFYNKTKIDKFKSDLTDYYKQLNFTVKFKDTYENQEHKTFMYVYSGKKDVNIKIEPRISSLVIADKTLKKSSEMINSTTENIHYITYNGTIAKKRFSGDGNFDLFRIKFNTQINKIKEYLIDTKIPLTPQEKYDHLVNIYEVRQAKIDLENIQQHIEKPLFETKTELQDFNSENNLELLKSNKEYTNIPSEFIDVSMPWFTDDTSKHFIHNTQEKLAHISSVIDDNFYFTNCYSKKQIYEDLEIILFQQNTFFPWEDKKYQKRIKRLITMLFITDLELINGKFKLRQETRKKIKELVNTSVKFINDVKTNADYVIQIEEIKKYVDLEHENIGITTDIVSYVINTFDRGNLDQDFRYLFKINNKYESIKCLLNFIFVFYKLFSKNNDTNNIKIIEFINIYKEKQLWEKLDVSNANNIVSELKDNYISLLETIIYTSKILLIIF